MDSSRRFVASELLRVATPPPTPPHPPSLTRFATRSGRAVNADQVMLPLFVAILFGVHGTHARRLGNAHACSRLYRWPGHERHQSLTLSRSKGRHVDMRHGGLTRQRPGCSRKQPDLQTLFMHYSLTSICSSDAMVGRVGLWIP